MWKVILASALRVVVTKLPWELITAKLMSYILERIKMDKAAHYEGAKVFVRRVHEQTALLAAALEDDKVDIAEVQAVVGAWAEGEPTPKELEAKILS